MATSRPENGAERSSAVADTDRVLLTRFVQQCDEAAFTEIVRRHSKLVFGVCHRTLRDRQAAEDAFQATFLVLAQSARSIRRRTSLGSWLHGVACRISLRALAKRHRRRETCSPMNSITTEPTLQDVGEIYEQQLLDTELQELPEKYREPLVLHYLQGLTNHQVADRLDVSVSCVEGRLKRGKKELRLRLTRRGLELGAALAAVHLVSAAAQAGALESLVTSTAHIAASQTLTSSTAAAVPSEAASQLATKEIAMLASAKTSILVSSVAAAVLTVGVVAGMNSSTQFAHADAPAGAFSTTPLLDSGIDASFEWYLDDLRIAQSGLPSQADADEASEQDIEAQQREALQRQIQALRDELRSLQVELEDRAAQQQVERRTAQQAEDELDAIRAQQQDLLGNLRQQLDTGSQEMDPLAARFQTFDYSESDPQTQRIKTALEESIDIEFPVNPLSDVLDYLSVVKEIPILFDGSRLLDVGISPDEEVSLVISGVTLENALDIMLNNLAGVELDYIVENQVLKITTREYADSVMDTRVYSLNQLPPEYSPEDIARVIIRTIAPETWRNSIVASEGGFGSMMEAGMGGEFDYEMEMMDMEEVQPVGGRGAGSVEPLPGVLVVTQSQRVHRQVVDLLSQLKRQYEVAGGVGGAYGGSGMDDMYGDYNQLPGAGSSGYGRGGSPGADFEDFGFGGDSGSSQFGEEFGGSDDFGSGAFDDDSFDGGADTGEGGSASNAFGAGAVSGEEVFGTGVR